VELGIVIGKTASYIDASQAMEHVAGYCVVNDVSEREYQIERGGTWDKGKGCDTFGPTGPGWSPGTRCRIRTSCGCGWKSMATATRTAAPLR
jgi:2-keto-4-pentenoate hydratase/2-oxohepta-3-ene-1,7-dioic acid hydratase in catechol pathway